MHLSEQGHKDKDEMIRELDEEIEALREKL